MGKYEWDKECDSVPSIAILRFEAVHFCGFTNIIFDDPLMITE